MIVEWYGMRETPIKWSCVAMPVDTPRKVDEAIETLTPFLQDIAKFGESKNISEPKLMQLIAVNSLLYSSMINKLGLLDTSDTAWKQDK
jgi:hypothetical protein